MDWTLGGQWADDDESTQTVSSGLAKRALEGAETAG